MSECATLYLRPDLSQEKIDEIIEKAKRLIGNQYLSIETQEKSPYQACLRGSDGLYKIWDSKLPVSELDLVVSREGEDSFTFVLHIPYPQGFDPDP